MKSPDNKLGQNLAKLAKEKMAKGAEEKGELERLLNMPFNKITKAEPQIVWQMAKTAYSSENEPNSTENEANSTEDSQRSRATPRGSAGPSRRHLNERNEKHESLVKNDRSRYPSRTRQDSIRIQVETSRGASARQSQPNTSRPESDSVRTRGRRVSK